MIPLIRNFYHLRVSTQVFDFTSGSLSNIVSINIDDIINNTPSDVYLYNVKVVSGFTLNGLPYPIVDGSIDGRNIMITGGFTQEGVERKSVPLGVSELYIIPCDIRGNLDYFCGFGAKLNKLTPCVMSFSYELGYRNMTIGATFNMFTQIMVEYLYL